MKKFKMADRRWPPFKNTTQFLRQMTSQVHVAELKTKGFWTYYLPFRFRCRSFNQSWRELRSSPPPGAQKTKKPSLNRGKFYADRNTLLHI